MNLKSDWAERFVRACGKVKSTRRRSLSAGQTVYSTMPKNRCWVVVAGYVKVLDPRVDDNRIILDVRLSHQDLAELVGAARPVVSAELVQMRREGLVEYTRCYFCVDDLDGLNRVAAG